MAAIPYGDRLTLTVGTTVYVTQALGGSYTAMTDHGYLVRIEGTDADAIGEQPTKPMTAEDVAGRSVEEVAWEQLKTVFDPEIPVNIVDLGLVYKCEVETLEDGKDKVNVAVHPDRARVRDGRLPAGGRPPEAARPSPAWPRPTSRSSSTRPGTRA